jgi:hypothetical protein
VSEDTADDVKQAELIVAQIQERQFNTGPLNLSAMGSQRLSIPGIVSARHHATSKSSCSAMPFKVMSVVGSSPSSLCVCVCLDSDGNVEDYLVIGKLGIPVDIRRTLNFRLTPQIKVRIAAFVQKANPQMIVVGAEGIGTKGLVAAMDNVLLEMSQDNEDEHRESWTELSRQIVIGDMKIPIALSELPVYTQTYTGKDYKHAELRQAVSLGRQLQDPLSEVAAIYSETEDSQLNLVKLHRLQSMLSTEHLRFA